MKTVISLPVTAKAWLARAPRPAARLRLFCLPYAGGGAGIYRNWSEFMEPWIDPIPIQLPGKDARLREAPYRDVQTLVERLSESLTPCLEEPYALFGHSLGALIAFELCRQIRSKGGPAPAVLFVSGYHSPQIPRRGKTLHVLSDSDFLEELRQLKGTPENVLRNHELMQLLLPVLRSDFEMHETYVHQASAPLDCPISVFGGLQDPHITHADLCAWRDQTSSDFRLTMFPGDHFFLHTARESILNRISDDLARLAGATVKYSVPYGILENGIKDLARSASGQF